MSKGSLSDIEVLETISGGLALKGILLENDCYSTSCETVIALPSRVTFAEPILEQTIQQKEFYSRKKKNDFLKSLENGEYSLTVNYEKLIDKLDHHADSYWNKHYFGIVRYCFLPVASFSFDTEEILLTDRCIRALRHLEEKFRMSSEDDKQLLCEDFFRQFGSHVNIGAIHFGGIFLWKSDYHSIDPDDNLIIKEISEKAIDSFVGVSKTFLKFPDLTERLSLEVGSIGGGSMTSNSFEKWQGLLRTDKSSWSLIDRGSDDNFIRSWNLLENHQNCFRNMSELRMVLDNAWEKYKEKRLLAEVTVYCHDPRFAKNCKIYLEILANSKMDPLSITEWQEIILKPEIIDLMMAVLRNKDNLDASDIYDIKRLLIEILEDTEGTTFPGKEDLQRWVNPSSVYQYYDLPNTYSVASFIEEIKQYMVPVLQETDANDETSKKEIECKYDFAARVKRAIHTFSSCNKYNDASFLKLMLLDLDYDLDFDIFPYCERMSLESVQRFIKRICNEYTTFKELQKKDVEAINFYLLDVALKAVGKEKDVRAKESKFKSLIGHINLEAGCRGIIESYMKESITWDKMIHIINVFNDNNHEPVVDTEDDTLATCEVDSLDGPATDQEGSGCNAINKYLPLASRVTRSFSKPFEMNVEERTSIDKRPSGGNIAAAVAIANETPITDKTEVQFDDKLVVNVENPCFVENKTIAMTDTSSLLVEKSDLTDKSLVIDDKVRDMKDNPSFIENTLREQTDKSSFIESYVNQTIAWGKLSSALDANLMDEDSLTEMTDSKFSIDLTQVTDTSISHSTIPVSNNNDSSYSKTPATDDDQHWLEKGNVDGEDRWGSVVRKVSSAKEVKHLFNELKRSNKSDDETPATDDDQHSLEKGKVEGGNRWKKDSVAKKFSSASCRDHLFNELKHSNKSDDDCIEAPSKRKYSEVERKVTCVDYYSGGDDSCIYATLRKNLRKVKSASDLSLPVVNPMPFDGKKSSSRSKRFSKHSKRGKLNKITAFKEKFEGWGSNPDLTDSSNSEIVDENLVVTGTKINITPAPDNSSITVDVRVSMADLVQSLNCTDGDNVSDVKAYHKELVDNDRDASAEESVSEIFTVAKKKSTENERIYIGRDKVLEEIKSLPDKETPTKGDNVELIHVDNIAFMPIKDIIKACMPVTDVEKEQEAPISTVKEKESIKVVHEDKVSESECVLIPQLGCDDQAPRKGTLEWIGSPRVDHSDNLNEQTNAVSFVEEKTYPYKASSISNASSPPRSPLKEKEKSNHSPYDTLPDVGKRSGDESHSNLSSPRRVVPTTTSDEIIDCDLSASRNSLSRQNTFIVKPKKTTFEDEKCSPKHITSSSNEDKLDTGKTESIIKPYCNIQKTPENNNTSPSRKPYSRQVSYESKSEPEVWSSLSRQTSCESKSQAETKAEESYTAKIQILDRLGLIPYFPSKISLSDVRRYFKPAVEDIYDVPWFFLNTILMLDYNGRNKLHYPQESNRQSENDINNDLDALFDTDMLNDKSINPLDVMVAVVLCADPFLKQLLAQKLYMCRLSIPFLVPQLTSEYVLQLWSIRGIALGSEFENDSAVSFPSPIVSFVRFGDLPQSKSKLLNDILSDQSSDTFFHKDCGNGSEKKILSDGMIDAAWSIPSPLLKCLCRIPNGCKCHISQLVMFLNLHGDCKGVEPSRKFLCRISNVVTALIDVRKLKNQRLIESFKQTVENTKKVLLVFTNERHLPTIYFKEHYGNLLKSLGRSKEKVRPLLTFSQDGKPLNLQKLKENIRSAINQLLSETDNVAKTLIDQFKYLYMANVTIDEEDPLSKSGHSDAFSVYNIMNNTDLGHTKDKFLPLQGELWKQWGSLERDMKRGQPNQNQSHEHYVSSLHMQQTKIRDEQVRIYWGSNRVMQMICANLLRLKGHELRFYIHWIRYYLDELSRRHLPQIRQKLQNKWSELTSLQQKGPEVNYKSEYTVLKGDIQDLEKCLERASLGLVHIFREVGQLYEAFSISTKADSSSKQRFDQLPHVMAQLLIMGYTMEIMDGNARQVPMTFIKAVFNELDKLIKGSVFILSVIGLQSSGKSTLLNAMFGVQFSTSAGRCTQGVNAQLVEMPKYIYEKFGYQYIMLIDTEGLRAADLGDENRQRDNELATLAVGLGDLSIINVKGENQAELNDVLQIVVHALLKIKMVNKRLRLQSSCFFIHQNVGAVDAEAKLREEQMKLAHKLDVIALSAAAQTGHHDITSFSKIIEFDVQRDIRYFCDLWQGDPPMAPTNPGYSKKVKDVKITILETIIPRKESKTDMKTLSSRLEDLWNGILDEDFVFSFKNSQEIKAYTTLETEFNNIKWDLKEKGLIWLNDHKVNVKGSSTDHFSVNEYQIQLEDKMEAAYEQVGNTLANFCRKSNDRNILEQWRGNYQLKLKDLKDETISETMKMLKDDIQIRKRQLENDKRSIAWKEAFRKKAIDLAKSESSSKMKLSSKEMESVFEELWTESLKELPLCKFDPEDNVELIVTSTLKKAARPNHQVFQHYYDCFKAGSLDITTYFQPMEKYIMKSDGLIKQLWRNFFHEYTEKVEEITQRIFKKVTNSIINMQQENFSKTHVDKVVEMVTREIEDWNQAGKLFELTAWYKVEMLVKVGEKVKPTFVQLQNNFRTKVDPRSQLEHFKSLLLTQFIDTIEKVKKEKTIAKLVSQVVESAIKEKTNIDLPRDLANDVRTNNVFMLSKKELLTKVLTDLANEDEFLEYMKFVDNTNEFLRGRLKKYTHEYLFSVDRKFTTLAINRYLAIFANVSKNLQSMRKVLEQPNVDPNIEDWTQSFIIAMKNTIPVTKQVMKDVIKDSTKEDFDIKVFDEFLMQRFNKVQDNLKLFYTNVNQLDDSIEQQVIQQLAGSVLGCSKQCPFCRVSCALTVNDHDVDCSSPQHYPKGVAGYHWTMNKKLAIDTCTTAVASDLTFRNIDTKYKGIPFKDYKKFYKTWKIQGDKSLDASLYWKWFMAKYIDQLAEYYHHERPSIPEAWNVPKEAAVRSLTQI